MIFLYTVLFYIFLPIIFARLYWRGRKNKMYREHWGERLGKTPFTLKSSLWLHAVSLGEAVAGTPLIEALLKAYPDEPIVVTTTTPTGSAHIQKLAQKHEGRLYHAYFPYDLPHALNRFFNRVHPRILIVMETELWPNVFAAANHRAVPIIVVNARISDKALPRYEKIKPWMPGILNRITHVAAQSERDQQRFIDLGLSPEKSSNAGNIKYDFVLPEDIADKAKTITATWPSRFVLIAASTHEGEEALFLDAYLTLKKRFPALLLILVPRHPERFARVESLIRDKKLAVLKRSESCPITDQTDVFLGDTMGELFVYYALSDLAFVGGSLIPIGGHNILEPAALKLPILMGPYMNNAKAVADDFLFRDAAVSVSPTQLAEDIAPLIENTSRREILGANAFNVLLANRGTLTRLLDVIKQQGDFSHA